MTARFDGLEQAVDLDHLDDHTRHVAVGATQLEQTIDLDHLRPAP